MNTDTSVRSTAMRLVILSILTLSLSLSLSHTHTHTQSKNWTKLAKQPILTDYRQTINQGTFIVENYMTVGQFPWGFPLQSLLTQLMITTILVPWNWTQNWPQRRQIWFETRNRNLQLCNIAMFTGMNSIKLKLIMVRSQ
jgi:hypothetical protein